MTEKYLVFHEVDEYSVAMNVSTVLAHTDLYKTIYDGGQKLIGPNGQIDKTTMVTEASKHIVLCEHSPTTNQPMPIRITAAMTETWLACPDFHIIIAQREQLKRNLKLQEETVDKPTNVCVDCGTRFSTTVDKCVRCGGRGLRLYTAEEKETMAKEKGVSDASSGK